MSENCPSGEVSRQHDGQAAACTSISRQVAKKFRSEASSNTSIANDRALPVCKARQAQRENAAYSSASKLVVEKAIAVRLYLGSIKDQQSRRRASVCIRIFENRGAAALSLSQTQRSLVGFDLFAPL